MSFSIADPVGAVIGAALDGVALRQRITADNIANIDTPHYRASSVDFETSLRAAISTGDLGSVTPTLQATQTPVGPNGNNVDLRKETLAAVQSQFQYQMLTRATTDRFNLLTAVAN